MYRLSDDRFFQGFTSDGQRFEIRFSRGTHLVLVAGQPVFEGWIERCVAFVRSQGWDFHPLP